jgi:hypothetical protein
MKSFHAHAIEFVGDFDYGEGWITFQWKDKLYGKEGLTIDLDGHCSRNMMIRSGTGPPEFIELQKDSLKLRFTPYVAKMLELDEEIQITFEPNDEIFKQLKQLKDYFEGCDSED